MLKLGIDNLSEGVIIHTLDALPVDLELKEFAEFGLPIKAKFTLNKVGEAIYVKADLTAECRFVCDRCLEPFVAKVSDSIRMIYTFSSMLKSARDENVFIITDGVSEIDVTQPVRETLIIALPSKRVCTDDCKGLCSQCGVNLNIASCTCEQNAIDPRWEALRKMMNEN